MEGAKELSIFDRFHKQTVAHAPGDRRYARTGILDRFRKEGRMLAAVKRNDLVAVRRLLAKRPTLVKVCEDYHWGGGYYALLRSLLHIAAIKGYSEMVKLLIDVGADINEQDRDGFPPLFSAVCSGRPDIVGTLIEKGATFNGNWSGISPLFIASEAGLVNIVALLIAAGADLNFRNTRDYGRAGSALTIPHGTTSLGAAVMACRYQVAELLRKHGAKE